VALFRRVCSLDALRAACINSEACQSPQSDRHCAACLEHMEGKREIERQLGLRPWQMLPTDFIEPDDAADMTKAALREYWRDALLEAAEEAQKNNRQVMGG
jgi:hypothetical protein